MYLVCTTFLALSYLAIVGPLHLARTVLPSPVVPQKLAVALEVYALTWVLLVLTTVAIDRRGLGGIYWVTVWNASTFLAAGVALVESGWRKSGVDLGAGSAQPSAGPRLVRGVRYDAPIRQGDGADGPGDDTIAEAEEIETDPTEITPLMQQPLTGEYAVNTGVAELKAREEEYGWWIAQVVVSIAPVALLLSELGNLAVLSLANTVCDGSSTTVGMSSIIFFSKYAVDRFR